MTYEQAVIFSILVGVTALFIWGRRRHDIVAVGLPMILWVWPL